MKAVILVGGEGKRMRPLTFHTPKPLLPIANVPFIERQIKWLEKYGINEVILSMSYLPDAFENYFKENPISGIQIEYAVESEPLGTAGAIKYAVGQTDDDILVCNGDVLTDLDLNELIAFHKSRPSTATIALTYVEDPSAFGVVPTHESGEVIAFVEKPPKDSSPSNWINAGIYVLASEFLELIPPNLNVSIERETFPIALQKGSMFALESGAYWIDIGTPTKYLRAHSDFLDDIKRFGEQDSLHQVVPNLYSDGEIQIGSNLIVKSNCIVGSGSVIGDNCVLEASNFGPKCTIENGVSIVNSVIYSGVRVARNTQIDSSIIGDACDISENVSITKETLIGSHEKIAPNTRLQGERIVSIV